jgi:uncharacterized delta-60 repeat protein
VYTNSGGTLWDELVITDLFDLFGYELRRVDGINAVYLFGDHGVALKKDEACSIIGEFGYTVNELDVQFTESTNYTTSWLWNFGDGTTSNLQNPMHSYAAAGTYAVCLKVSNPSCGTDSICQNVSTCEANYTASITGALDPSFDGDGLVTAHYNSYSAFQQVSSILVQPDGKVVASGRGNANISRFNTNGSPDFTFGTNGTVVSPVYISKSLYTIDGKILTAGSYASCNLVQYLNDGSPDASFGVDGIVALGEGTSLMAFKQKPDGKILLVTGKTYLDIDLIQLNANGTYDSTFSGDGIEYVNAFDNIIYTYFGGDILLQPDGKILISCSSYGLVDDVFIVLRLNSDGTTDASFGTDGIKMLNILPGNGSFDVASKLLLQDDGKIIVAGQAGSSSYADRFAAARLYPDGSMDSSFATNGIFTLQINNAQSTFEDAVLQADGKIIMGGTTVGLLNKLAIIRLNENGSIDSTFGKNGIVTTTLNCNPTAAYSLAIDSVYLYAAGSLQIQNQPAWDFLITRYLLQCIPVEVAFDFEASEGEVSFTNQSYYTTSWHWDFGDGTTSTDQNPTHQYQADGIYEVCLVAENECSADTICQTIIINITSDQQPSINDYSLMIAPNPVYDFTTISFSIKNNEAIKMELYDLHGRKIKTIAEGNFPTGNHELNFSAKELPAGVYLVRLLTKDLLIARKLIVE